MCKINGTITLSLLIRNLVTKTWWPFCIYILNYKFLNVSTLKIHFVMFCFGIMWCVWVRQLIQSRIQHKHGGAKHGSIQRRPKLRRLFPNQMCKWPKMVSPGNNHRHRHKLLSAELCSSQRRRRLVQSSSTPLRFSSAHLSPHR